MSDVLSRNPLAALTSYEMANLPFHLTQAGCRKEFYELLRLEYHGQVRELPGVSARGKTGPFAWFGLWRRKGLGEALEGRLNRWEARQRYRITDRLHERARARQEQPFRNAWYDTKLRAGLPAEYHDDLQLLV